MFFSKFTKKLSEKIDCIWGGDAISVVPLVKVSESKGKQTNDRKNEVKSNEFGQLEKVYAGQVDQCAPYSENVGHVVPNSEEQDKHINWMCPPGAGDTLYSPKENKSTFLHTPSAAAMGPKHEVHVCVDACAPCGCPQPAVSSVSPVTVGRPAACPDGGGGDATFPTPPNPACCSKFDKLRQKIEADDDKMRAIEQKFDSFLDQALYTYLQKKPVLSAKSCDTRLVPPSQAGGVSDTPGPGPVLHSSVGPGPELHSSVGPGPELHSSSGLVPSFIKTSHIEALKLKLFPGKGFMPVKQIPANVEHSPAGLRGPHQPVGGRGHPFASPVLPAAGRGRGAGNGAPGTPRTPGANLFAGLQQTQVLNIVIKPTSFDYQDEHANQESCRSALIKEICGLYKHITNTSSIYDWGVLTEQYLNETEVGNNRRFLAFVIAFVANNKVPGCFNSYSPVDFFEYDEAGYVKEALLNYHLGHVLSGVCYEHPQKYIKLSLDSEVDQHEDSLRPAIMLALNMIRDLNNKSISLKVDYKYHESDQDNVNNIETTTTYSSEFIHGVLYNSLTEVETILGKVYDFQNSASSLANGLKEINEEALEQLEEQYMLCVTDAETVDMRKFKEKLQIMLKASNQAKKLYEEYVKKARGVSEDGGLNKATAQSAFESINVLIAFLENRSGPDEPWVESASRWCSVKSQVVLDGSSLKVMANPSRIFVNKSLTSLDKTVSRTKDLVMKSTEYLRERQTTASRAGSLVPDRRSPEKGQSTDLKPYPSNLFEDAAELDEEVRNYNDDNAPEYVIQDQLERVTQTVNEIKKHQWAELQLYRRDEETAKSLNQLKTVLRGALQKKKQEARGRENQEREVGRAITATKSVVLEPDGNNIQEFLDFHSIFKSSNKLSRAMKLRENLPKQIQVRCANLTEPEDIIDLLSRLYLQSDVLVPQAFRQVQKCKQSPVINSPDEANSYAAIFALITKLKKQNMLQKFDFTMLQQCLSKLSKQRVDQFEQSWIEQQFKKPLLTPTQQEEMKQTMFFQFIELHENLLHRRMLQNSMMKEEKEDKKEIKTKVFTTNLRETRYDKRQQKKVGGSAAAPAAVSTAGPAPVDTSIVCPACKGVGGHPRTRPPNVGKSARSVARCPILKSTKQAEKLAFVVQIACCPRCLSSTHANLQDCKLPTTTPWLQHEECNQDHNPVICPVKQPAERMNKTQAPEIGSTVVNLAEKVEIADSSGRKHSVLAIYDNASDSNWCSSDIAKTFPQSSRSKVVFDLSTIKGEQKIATWQYKVAINVNNTMKSIVVNEAPSIGSLKGSEAIAKFIESKTGIKVTLPEGNVQILLGLKSFAFHPVVLSSVPLSPEADHLKLFKSSTRKNRILAAGFCGSTLIGGPCTDEEAKSSLFSQAQLMQVILNDRALDVSPKMCDFCATKTKECIQCKLSSKPTSYQDAQEVKMVKNSMHFDKGKHKISVYYEPTISSFEELFPAHLSNRKQATRIAEKVLKSLKSEGKLDDYQQQLEKYVEIGIFEEVPADELAKVSQECHNYVSHHPVYKEQTSEEKIKTRIVVNSSLPRQAIVNNTQVKTSLNNVLPQASPSFNSLAEIGLKWMTGKYSSLIDIIKAYSQMYCEPSEKGRKTKNMRLLQWFKNPKEENPEVTTYRLTRVHFGDSNASAMLNNVIEKISEELKDNGKEEASKACLEDNFVDDFISSWDSKEKMFSMHNDIQEALKEYSIELHTPVFSCREGVLDDEESKPRSVPNEGEIEEHKIIGFNYFPHSDSVSIPVPRNINKKVRGLREGKNLEQEDIKKLDVTLRLFSSFQHSLYDPLGLMAPLTIKAKSLLSKITKMLPPVTQENWDSPLPEPLMEEAREYISLVVGMQDPKFDRFPPPGVLTEFFIHEDGSSVGFGTVVWAVYVEPDGKRHGKLLYSKPRTSHQTVPRHELEAILQATSISKILHKLFPEVKVYNIFSDSESALKMISSVRAARDVFETNRINSIVSHLKELEEKDVLIKINQVASEDNEADIVTKFKPGAEKYIQSKRWLEGVHWLKLPVDQWPVTRRYKLEEGLVQQEGKDDDNIETVLIMRNEAEPKGDDEFEGENVEEFSLNENDDQVHEDPFDVDEDNNVEESNDDEETINGKPDEVVVPIFTKLLKNVSKPRLAVRCVARIKKALQMKSFKALKQSPDEIEEGKAWILLMKDQQQIMSKGVLENPKLMSFKEDGVYYTRQRWSEETHLELFNVDKLPLCQAQSKLGEMLIQDSHRPADPKRITGRSCLSKKHAKRMMRTSKRPAFMVGNEEKVLNTVRRDCVKCKVSKIAFMNGETSKFSPKMKSDNFKLANPGKEPWKHICVDSTGPLLVTNEAERKETRKGSQKKYTKKHILCIVDCGGLGSIKYKQMADLSAQAFAQTLAIHFAESGVVASRIFTDSASGFLAVAAREKENNNDLEKTEEDNDEVARLLETKYPGIQFQTAPSSSQYRNSLSELAVKGVKGYIKDVLDLKPNSSIPKFTTQGLDLILAECSQKMNDRPIGWLKDENQYLSANKFLQVGMAERTWNEAISLDIKYESLKDYRDRMNNLMRDYMINHKFLPTRWFEEGKEAKKADVIMISRGKQKLSPLGKLEYGLVKEVSSDGRTLQVRVSRAGTANVKEISVDSRNCYLVYRAN